MSLPEYGANMKAGQRDIYYLAAPSRQLAESSPYFEALREKEVEILFCYEPYDELVLMQLQQFDKKNMTSVEKEMQQTPEEVSSDSQDAMDLSNWIQSQLGSKAAKVFIILIIFSQFYKAMKSSYILGPLWNLNF